MDHAQAIAHPLDDRPADENAALQGIAGGAVGAGGHGGHQAVFALENIRPGVHQQEAAGAVCILRLTWGKAGLPKKRGLLVARAPGNGDLHAGIVHAAVNGAGGLDFRQHVHGDIQCLADFFIPAHVADIIQHGAAGVGVVGHMRAPAGQLPDEPGIHRAEEQTAFLGHLAGIRHIVQDPLDLGAGKIGIDEEASVLADVVLQALALELLAQGGGTAALPNNGIVDGAAGFLIPHDGGLALVGDADGRDFLRLDIAFGQYFYHHAVLGGVDLHGVMLHIAGLGVVLGELLLSHGDDILLPVEQNGAGTGGTLIQGDNILLHGGASLRQISNSHCSLFCRICQRKPARNAGETRPHICNISLI